MKKRQTLALIPALLGALAGLTSPVHAASDYPNRPIRVVVPFAPGGASDTITRRIGNLLASRLGQPIVIENKAGGNTMIASEYVAKATADGYTLYSTNTAIMQVPMLYQAQYDEARDFAPISLYASAPLVLTVPASSSAKSVKQLVDALRSKPNKTSYGSAGSGGAQNIYSEVFKRATGVDSIHVPYRGEAPLLNDFLGDRIDWYIATPLNILPHVRAGKARLLAVTGSDRVPLMPDVPTFNEQGISGLEVIGWYGMFAPAGTPPEIVERLGKEIAEIVKMPEISNYMKENGLIPKGLNSAEFVKQLPYFRNAYRTMITENHIKVD